MKKPKACILLYKRLSQHRSFFQKKSFYLIFLCFFSSLLSGNNVDFRQDVCIFFHSCIKQTQVPLTQDELSGETVTSCCIIEALTNARARSHWKQPTLGQGCPRNYWNGSNNPDYIRRTLAQT